MKNYGELRAIDVQIIAKGMEKQRLERELQDNRDRWTNKELTDEHRKFRIIKLKQVNREYKNLIKRGGYKEEDRERYMEREAERRREDEILRRDDLYDYEEYND